MNHANRSVPAASSVVRPDSERTFEPSGAELNPQVQRVLSVSPVLRLLAGLASLRLTVVLLITSVFMIWVATLQQTEHDIWTVKAMHFPALWVWIPFYTFCPPAWLPEWRTALSGTTVPLGVYLPSGFSLIIGMIINLLAAHSLRFKLQASGKSLIAGLLLSAIGVMVCAVVVLLGQGDGVQALPPVPYGAIWNAILGLMWVAGFYLAYMTTTLASHRTTEKILIASMAMLMLVMPVMLWFSGASIGESGMRILWQIIQCMIASLVLYAGLQVLFKRKGGMVLLHAGMLLLLGNEIWVTMVHQEQRLTASEGQTIAYTYDIRATELAIIDRSGPEDKIIAVPSSLLRTGEWFDIPGTTLRGKGLAFFKNSTLVPVTADNLATTGVGTSVQAIAIDPVDGLDMRAADFASAYVQFVNQQGQELGTFLVSQFQNQSQAPIVKRPNVLVDGEQKYVLSLWFQRFYKPYRITVNEVEAKNYPGTTIPRWYSTEFKIKDVETNFEGGQLVKMNDPLRYRNETFYQSGYDLNEETGQETTTLQVVLNRGWMIPYLCCAMVALGLMAHFIPMMLAYFEKAQRPRPLLQSDLDAASSARRPGRAFWHQWKVPILAAVLVSLLLAGWAMPKSVKVGELKLNDLATLPVSYKGRVQPFDSLARTMLRKTVGMEETSSDESTIFGSAKRYPATRWLADAMFSEKSSVNYQVFRIDNRQILDAMKLPHRPGFRYTSEEVFGNFEALRALAVQANQKEADDRSNDEKIVLDLTSNLLFVRKVINSLALKADDESENLNAKLFSAADTASTSEMPGLIPGVGPDDPWLAISTFEIRSEFETIANAMNMRNADDLATGLMFHALAEQLIQDPLILAELPESIAGQTRPEQISFFARRLAGLPPEKVTQLIETVLKFDSKLYLQEVYRATELTLGGKTLEPLTAKQKQAVQAWEKIADAYRSRDQDGLDVAVTEYRTLLEADSDREIPWAKIKTEYQLSAWAPFYVSTVIYLLAAIISAFGLMLGNRAMNHFSLLMLLLGLGFHTVGILARIYISGRAPVTSIYSSALAIAWGSVLAFWLIEIATRKSIGSFMAGLTGFLILLVAYGLSLSDDKFAVLVAVLDTQFWLWTHVTCVALGYVLTFVAGFWAIGYLVMGLMPGAERAEVKRSADITYGLIAAATFLSFVGTVLGGLWADDSWGRFWGWDPKENGAAMIVLWNAAVLHARWAGLIRYRGLAAMAIFGNVITAWSWFAVNELGIGLHSYGFTEGVIYALSAFWISQFALMCLAFVPSQALNAKA